LPLPSRNHPEARHIKVRGIESRCCRACWKRGLDVTPMMIERLERAGDHGIAEVLRLILREDVRHLAIGSHWFTWCCTHAGVYPESTFEHLIQTHARGAIRAPFNREQRRAAGFSEREMRVLARIDAEGRGGRVQR